MDTWIHTWKWMDTWINGWIDLYVFRCTVFIYLCTRHTIDIYIYIEDNATGSALGTTAQRKNTVGIAHISGALIEMCLEMFRVTTQSSHALSNSDLT